MDLPKENQEDLLCKSYYKSVKTSLKSIVKNPEVNLEKIQNAVCRTNKTITHSLQFLKFSYSIVMKMEIFPSLIKH